jgi:phosphoribosylglycinamide formyltransferase
VLVLANRKHAFGLERAARAAPPIPTAYCALQPFLKTHPGSTRADYDAEIARLVLAAQPTLVVLAGWMHVMGPAFLDAVHVPVLNLHPALPGAFDGVDAIARAHAAFGRGEVDRTGVMVHRVVAEVDRGAPVLVREVPIHPDEDLAALEQRVHETEWAVIVEATAMVLREEAAKA